MFHEPPYSTSQKSAPATWLRLPFGEWGASFVINGHQHVYERLETNGLTFVINGVGGMPMLYDVTDEQGCTPAPESKFRYNKDFGFMLGVVDEIKNNLVI